MYSSHFSPATKSAFKEARYERASCNFGSPAPEKGGRYVYTYFINRHETACSSHRAETATLPSSAAAHALEICPGVPVPSGKRQKQNHFNCAPPPILAPPRNSLSGCIPSKSILCPNAPCPPGQTPPLCTVCWAPSMMIVLSGENCTA